MTVLLAIAAWFLGLSVLVQVIQELWKYLTSSKARTFEMALTDLVGPSVQRTLRQDPTITVRGPLQFRRVGRAGYVLPTDKDELLFALENGAPTWHWRVLRALQDQQAISGSEDARPGVRLTEVLDALQHAAADPSAPGNPAEVHDFLKQAVAATRSGDDPWSAGRLNASTLLAEFQQRFFGHLRPLADHYPQLMRNFEFAYQRRNLRQSFVIALLVAIVCNLPFEVIYQRAIAMSPEDALEMAADAQALYARLPVNQRPQQTAAAAAPGTPSSPATQTAQTTPATQATPATPAPGAAPAAAPSQETQDTQALLALAREAVALTCRDRDTLGDAAPAAQEIPASCVGVDYLTKFDNVRNLLSFRSGWPLASRVRYLLGCLFTAILLSFGAPFWNDIVGSLGKSARPPKADSAKASA